MITYFANSPDPILYESIPNGTMVFFRDNITKLDDETWQADEYLLAFKTSPTATQATVEEDPTAWSNRAKNEEQTAMNALRIILGAVIKNDEYLHTIRNLIVKASASLSDEDALEVPELFDEWKPGVEYKVKEEGGVLIKPRIVYENVLYRVEQTHTSQEDWKPNETPALYTKVPKPGEIPVWVQPTGAQDAYRTGDKVHFPTEEDPVYISTCDNNVWMPGVYGWELY